MSHASPHLAPTHHIPFLQTGVGNPITALANQYGVAYKTVDLTNNQLYNQTGAAVSSTVPDALYRSVHTQVKALRNTLNSDISYASAFYSVAAAMYPSLSPTQLSYLRYGVASRIEHEYACDATDLSVWYFDEGAPLACLEMRCSCGRSLISRHTNPSTRTTRRCAFGLPGALCVGRSRLNNPPSVLYFDEGTEFAGPDYIMTGGFDGIPKVCRWPAWKYCLISL